VPPRPAPPVSTASSTATPTTARFWLPTTITLADDRSGFIVTEAGNRQRRHVSRTGLVRTVR
jgi:hypothetical protein